MLLPCPYCGKPFAKLTYQHCKKHGKTLSEVRKEYPKLPSWFTGIVMTTKVPKTEYQKMMEDYWYNKRTTLEVNRILEQKEK